MVKLFSYPHLDRFLFSCLLKPKGNFNRIHQSTFAKTPLRMTITWITRSNLFASLPTISMICYKEQQKHFAALQSRQKIFRLWWGKAKNCLPGFQKIRAAL
jgi:hypothetical protein